MGEARQNVHITLKEFENVSAFSNCTEHEDMVVFFASLGAAALSRTHCSRHELHSVEAAFTLCLLCFRARLLALSFSLQSPFAILTS